MVFEISGFLISYFQAYQLRSIFLYLVTPKVEIFAFIWSFFRREGRSLRRRSIISLSKICRASSSLRMICPAQCGDCKNYLHLLNTTKAASLFFNSVHILSPERSLGGKMGVFSDCNRFIGH